MAQRLYISFILHQTSTSFIYVHLQQKLYISFILHQTATLRCKALMRHRCISPLSYIKPQPVVAALLAADGCISPLSYIKPQPYSKVYLKSFVVYLLYPTSNRNLAGRSMKKRLLYISFILHQTATVRSPYAKGFRCISPLSYIKPQQWG